MKLPLFGLLAILCLNEVTSSVEDTLHYRLRDIPSRLQGLAKEIFPNGIPNEFLDMYIPTNANSSICRNHSAVYLQEFKNFTPWALQMWDSSGKLPVGLYYGNFYHLGSYEECMEVTSSSPFKVRSCLVQFGNMIRPQKTPKNWFQEEVDTITGGIPVLKERLTIAMCLPASCSLEDLRQHYQPLASKFNSSLHFDQYSCSKTIEEMKITKLEMFSFVMLPCMFAIVLLATIIDAYFLHCFKKGFLKELIRSFSAGRNGSYLLKSSDSFSSIDGIRFLSVLWIMMSHHSLFDIVKPAVNYLNISQLYSKWYATVILNGVLGVDNFIIINGVLLTYYFLINMKAGIKFNLPMFYLHRLIRVFPAYLFQILMTMTLYPRMFGGPMWEYFVGRHRDICQKNWWTNVLFINNYVEPDFQCIPSSWYLSVDMQLYILSPLILIPLYRWKKSPKYLISALIIVGNVISFGVSYYNEFPAGSVVSSNYDAARKHAGQYVTTHTRLGPWGVGIGLGYILFLTRGKNVTMNKNIVSLCWILCVVCAGCIFQSITYFHQDENPYNRLLSSAYTGLGSSLWALCISWVIFATEHGYGGPVGRFLSWNFFQPLSKLTYVIYLVHVGVEYAYLALIKSAAHFEVLFTIRETAGEILISILLSPIVSLVFEMPFINVERVIRKKFLGSQKSRVQESTEKPGDGKQIENLKLVNKAFVK
ncbi:nose resistant to fluoxetine protein 6 [Nilaparvata lugens]|uniref:nose resistant to fluoxetine protein 6 n=1 Tax=Nilaparvata lugens TaxID=108931 RepID=UPI00193E9D6B|nr:nose resistant to fluoxetine protein 6 [Nilaparvata lugens]